MSWHGTIRSQVPNPYTLSPNPLTLQPALAEVAYNWFKFDVWGKWLMTKR